MGPYKSILIVLLGALLFTDVSALECYVCSNQTGNVEKCLNTIKTCEQGEDMCMWDIRWGSTPYWSEGAPKQFYVSKRCATKPQCERRRKQYMKFCTHIWYEDWACSDCCQGDRCNYFVISGSSTLRNSVIVITISTLFTLWKIFL